jgi:hypothetical protein
MYEIKKGSKILKGGVAIPASNIEEELDEKTIAILLKKKTLIKIKTKTDGEKNGKGK